MVERKRPNFIVAEILHHLVKVQEIEPKKLASVVDAIKMVLFQFFNHSVNAASVQRTKQGFL